jgi:hypothetical protein
VTGQAVVTHTRIPIGLRGDPVVDRLFGRLELGRQILRRSSCLHQLDHVGPEFHRVWGTMPAHFDTS